MRFLALVLSGWIGLRTWQLWPAPPVGHAVPITTGRIERRDAGPVRSEMSPMIAARIVAAPVPDGRKVAVSRIGPARAAPPVAPAPTPPDPVHVERPAPRPPPRPTPILSAVPDLPAAPAAPPRRWSASGWAMVRASGAGGVSTPQLGGSQAGIRFARALDSRGRLTIAARVATALDSRQQEVALGVEWRPTTLPVRIVAERRFGIAGQHDGGALGLVGGVSDRSLPAGFRLEGYAQAGAVFRDGVEGYADGAARLTRPMARTGGGATFALGIGLWGGAQRSATRFDLGPAAKIDLPVTRTAHLRVALEWRQRVVGAARPGSGPALSIGTDY